MTCMETSLRIGSCVTISQLETVLTDLSHTLPGTGAPLRTAWLSVTCGNVNGEFH